MITGKARQESKDILNSVPSVRGWGNDRKVDIMRKTAEIASTMQQRITDYATDPQANDIDKTLYECYKDTVRMLIVISEHKLQRVLLMAEDLILAANEKHNERKNK